jgi:hypothetical protein
MQPINYLTQVADPFAQSLQGFQLGSGIVETQQKQALAEQQRQQKQAIFEQQQQQQQLAAQEQARFFAKPNPTMRDALQFAAVLPKDRADALRPYIENFSKAQQQSVLKTNRQILSALQVNPETAIKFLKDYATAQRNSGDQEEALLYESIAEQAADPTRGPSMAFKSMVTVTSLIPGAKEMFEAIDKASTTARTEELAPSVLKKSVADANVAVAMAEQKVLEAAGTPARLEAEQNLRLAQIAQQEALTAASVGGEGRAAGLAPSVLGKSVADAAAAVADAEKKVFEAKDTPARLEAEQGLMVAQANQQRALTAASVGGETRAAAKGPSELKKAVADADKAKSDADKAAIELKTLALIKNAELLKAKSDADKAAIEAKFATRIAEAELKLKSNQSIASAASTKLSLASAGLTEQQRLKLVKDAESGPMPVFNSQLGGFVVPITAKNPSGGFIPLNEAVKVKDQQAAIKALKTAGYDPETGEDNITRLIKRSTGGTLGAVTDVALRAFGVSDSGADAINALASTSNAIATDLLGGKLGAGISNADRDFIVATLGDVANPYKTNDERLAGWNTAKNRMMLSGMIPPPKKVKPQGSFGEADAPTVPNPAKAAAIAAAVEKHKSK